MIREFKVRNYLSIRDEQTLDFRAKGPESEIVAKLPSGEYLYKLGVLFGANASGKSNMLWALTGVFGLLVSPLKETTDSIGAYIPFALTKDRPTGMYVSFYADGIRYDYQVEYDGKRIYREKLDYYPNGSKSLFYERDYVSDGVQPSVKFGLSLGLSAKTKERICENTLNNHSVLSVCKKNVFKEDIAPLMSLHKYIMTYYHEVDGDNDDKSVVGILKDAYADDRQRRYYTKMLCKADLNIVGFKPVLKDRVIPQELRERVMSESIPDSVKEAILKPVQETIEFSHGSADGEFTVPLNLQSKGTIRYITMLGALYDMITADHVYYLDECGEDLHPDLLFYYLSVFLYNSRQSQLIITSQEATLLLQDIINENRGTVWMVVKNRDTASSEYTRGDTLGLHKNLSMFNAYRIGRLGTTPELGSIFIDLND